MGRVAGANRPLQLQLCPDEAGQLRAAAGRVAGEGFKRKLDRHADGDGLVIRDSLIIHVPMGDGVDPAVLERFLQVRGGETLHQVLAGVGVMLQLDNVQIMTG